MCRNGAHCASVRLAPQDIPVPRTSRPESRLAPRSRIGGSARSASAMRRARRRVAIIAAALATVVVAHGRCSAAPLSGLQTGFDVGLVVAVLVVLVGASQRRLRARALRGPSGQFSRAFPLWNLHGARRARARRRHARGRRISARRAGRVLFARTRRASSLTRRAPRGRAVGACTRAGSASPRRRRRRRLRARNRRTSTARRRRPKTAREFVCSFALREAESFFLEDLALAVAAIRLHRPDDVFVALPWSRARSHRRLSRGADEIADRSASRARRPVARAASARRSRMSARSPV